MTFHAKQHSSRRWAQCHYRVKQLRSWRARLNGVPDWEPAPWYRFGTRCIVLSVQIVHGPGHIGRGGRSGTHRHRLPLGWGPKGRWFKSSRPDFFKFGERRAPPASPSSPRQFSLWPGHTHGGG
jgi:hypothetical protein